MFGTDNVLCEKCKQYVHVDDCWLADEGVLCKDCCKTAYPEKFRKCYCGMCNECTEIRHSHEWKQYIGFRDTYEYCSCGEKRFPK